VNSSRAVIVVGMAEDGGTPASERMWATAKEQWPHIVVGLIFAIVILAVLAISVLGYVFHWGWTGVTEKKFWHWLELLIVPIVLSGGGFLLYRTWTWVDKRIAEKHEAEKRGHEAVQDANLDQIAQRYLDSIQELIVDREAPEKEQEAHHNAKLSRIALTFER
jgi:ABC-type nickel/cobalt efflux system permease component RcnA